MLYCFLKYDVLPSFGAWAAASGKIPIFSICVDYLVVRHFYKYFCIIVHTSRAVLNEEIRPFEDY